MAPDAPAILSSATALFRQGRLAEAERCCTRVLETHPDHAPACHLLGLIAHRGGRPEHAVQLLERAVILDASQASYHADLGAIKAANADFEGAAAGFRRATEIEPRNLDAMRNLGLALNYCGRLDESIAALRRAAALAPGVADCHLKLGAALQESAELEEAMSAYRTALEIEPRNPHAHFNLGTVLGRLARGEEAIAAYDRATEIDPGYARAHRNKGTLYLALDDPEAALPASKRATELMPNDVLSHMDYARALLRLERPDEAMAAFTRATELAPSSPDTHIHVGYAQLALGDPSAAVDAIEVGLGLDPRSTFGLALKAMALVESGDRAAAAALLDLERLVHTSMLRAPAGYRDLGDFNAALVEHICAHPTLEYSSANRSVVAGQGTGELLAEPKGPFAAFETMIGSAVEQYIAAVCTGLDHPSLSDPPKNWRPSVWATVFDSQGHQTAHFHPPGWLSGVYYPQLPGAVTGDDPERAGWIEFGAPYSRFALKAKFEVRSVRPQEGLMLLFPSYLCHRTVPFESAEKRISIAFDIVPEK